MSAISRQSAVFFQTEDFGSVIFNTFLGCNRLGHPMHPLSKRIAQLLLASNRMVGKTKDSALYLSIYCNLALKSLLKMDHLVRP